MEVRNEVWLPNRERRTDIRVLFADGSQVALEAQRSHLTDATWTARHHDYRHAGVTDEWLWHPDHPIPWMILNDARRLQQMWILDPWSGSITLMVGAPHQHRRRAVAAVLGHHVEHVPPFIRDDLIPCEFSLSEMTLTREGITIPAPVRNRLADQLERECQRLQALEDVAQQAPSQLSAPEQPSTVIPDGSLAQIAASWPAVRAQTRQISAAVHTLLSGASESRLDRDTLVLTHQHAVLARRLAVPERTEVVRQAVQQVLGRDYQIQWRAAPAPW